MTQFSVSLDKIAQQLKLEVVYTPKELKDIPIYTADVNRPHSNIRQCRDGLPQHIAGGRAAQPHAYVVCHQAARPGGDAQPGGVQ